MPLDDDISLPFSFNMTNDGRAQSLMVVNRGPLTGLPFATELWGGKKT